MKAKKVLAMLMASMMLMGTTVTAFAADSTTIAVENGKGTLSEANLAVLQIIKADPTQVTGWTFTNGAGEYFIEAFGENTTTEQQAIWQLIKYQYQNDNDENTNVTDLPDYVEEYDNITSSQIDSALSLVWANLSRTFQPEENSEFTRNEVGVYAIHAGQKGYTYKMMAAYVGFEDALDGTYPTLPDRIELDEKGAPTTITKSGIDDNGASDNDNNEVVAIGDIVTYTITMAVPYVDPTAFADPSSLPSFVITDEIDGAEYKDLATTATATLQGVEGNLENVEFVKTDPTSPNADGAFKVDLSSLLNAENSNAGKIVTINYKATITELTPQNTAKGHMPDSSVEATENFKTGQITITKYGETDDPNNALSGAGFEVTKVGDDAQPLTFRAEAYTLNDGEQLPVPGSYIYDPEGDITEVFTGSAGTVVIKGLDVGTYHFEETTAPEGYSINEDGVSVTIINDVVGGSGCIEFSDKINDTKLSSLPSTGGIGTTIFTIGGCVIMVTAAGLYFATRKKEQN